MSSSGRSERQGEVGDLKSKTREELRELLLRQEKLLSNRKFLKNLPDGGRKILDFAERVRLAICERDEVEQKQSLQVSVGTELRSKYQQAFSMRQRQPQNGPGEGAQEMDTTLSDPSHVWMGAEETPVAGDSSRTEDEDLLAQALENVTLSDASSTSSSKDVLNTIVDRGNFFLGKVPPTRPHYLEVLEKTESISVYKKQRFKPNQLSSRVDQHSSSESLSTDQPPPRPALSAQARKEMDRKHLNDITAARQAPLHYAPAQLLSLKESAALLQEQTRKHQEIQSRMAAQKLSEALKVSMGNYTADTGPMAAYREVHHHDEAQPSSDED